MVDDRDPYLVHVAVRTLLKTGEIGRPRAPGVSHCFGVIRYHKVSWEPQVQVRKYSEDCVGRDSTFDKILGGDTPPQEIED